MAINLNSMNHKQLADLIRRAQTRQRALAKEKAATLRARIGALVKAEGLRLDDVFGSRATAAAKKAPAKKTRTRSKVKPKYRNPATGETWAGRGKRPRWFAAALAAGKKDKDFLIKS